MQIWFVCKCSTLPGQQGKLQPDPGPNPQSHSQSLSQSPFQLLQCNCSCCRWSLAKQQKGVNVRVPLFSLSLPLNVCVWGGSSNMLPANSFSFHFSWHFYARMINYAILHLLRPELPPLHPPCPRGAALRSLSHQSASTLALSGNRRRLVPQLNFTAGVKVPQLAAIKKGCNQGWQHE